MEISLANKVNQIMGKAQNMYERAVSKKAYHYNFSTYFFLF